MFRAMNAGLCTTCVHSQTRSNDRGSLFYLCGLAEKDNAFPRFPRLPVLQCAGFTTRPESGPIGHADPPCKIK